MKRKHVTIESKSISSKKKKTEKENNVDNQSKNSVDNLEPDVKIKLTKKDIDDIGDYQNHVFVNRTNELSQLYEINVRNNYRSNNEFHESQRYTIPCSFHTYGAGKTQLGLKYIEQIQKEALLLEMQKYFPPGTQIHSYFKEQIEDSKSMELKYIRLNECTASDVKKNILRESLVGEACPNTSISLILDNFREKNALFLIIDEIAALQTYEEFIKLRNFFGDYLAGQRKQDLKPFHIYFCGRLPRSFMEKVVEGGNGNSGAIHKLIYLEPLTIQFIEEIYNHVFQNGTKIENEELKQQMFSKIYQLTAGIPRLIWEFILSLYQKQQQFSNIEQMNKLLVLYSYEIIRGFPSHCSDLDHYEVLDFLHLIHAEANDLTINPKDHAQLFEMCRYLPAMFSSAQTEDPEEKKIVTAPMFSIALEEKINQTTKKLIDGSLVFQNFIGFNGLWHYYLKDRANSREWDVVYALITNLFSDLFEAKIYSDFRPGHILNTTIYKLLPILKIVNNFPDFDIKMKYSVAQCETKFTTNTKAQKNINKYEEIQKNCGNIVIAAPQSSSADLFVPLENLVIEFQIKSTDPDKKTPKQYGPCHLKKEINKMAISQDEQKRTILLFLAEMYSSDMSKTLKKQKGIIQSHDGKLNLDGKEEINIPKNSDVIIFSKEIFEKYFPFLNKKKQL